MKYGMKNKIEIDIKRKYVMTTSKQIKFSGTGR